MMSTLPMPAFVPVVELSRWWLVGLCCPGMVRWTWQGHGKAPGYFEKSVKAP